MKPACFRIPWEPQCQAVTALELEMEKAVLRGWLAPSLWVIMETLSPDTAEGDCVRWWGHLSDEILTPWHLKTFHNMWAVGPSVWYPGYIKIWVVLFYFWCSYSFQCVKKKTKIHFFPDYKNNALFIVQKLEKIKNTRRKFYHQRDRF